MKSLIIILTQGLLFHMGYAQSNISNKCIHTPDTLDGMEVFNLVEIQPEYTRGMEKFFIGFSEIIKDTTIKKDITESKYYFTFVIDTTGSIRSFCIIKPDGLVIEEEKLKKLNNWTPGIQRGKKVPVRMLIPVNIEWR